MQVILRVLDSPGENGQMWLRSGQLAEVGRSEYVDFAVPSDPSMCEVHFSLYCDGRFCYIKDLSRGVGTILNGQPVGESYLKNGDQIAAGETLFLLEIQGGTDVTEEKIAKTIAPAAPEAPDVDPDILDAEQSYRNAMAELDKLGPIKEESPDILYTYGTMAEGLSDVLRLQGKDDEADHYKKMSEEIFNRKDVQKFLDG